MTDDPFAPPDRERPPSGPSEEAEEAEEGGPLRLDRLRPMAAWQAAASAVWVLVGGVTAAVAVAGEWFGDPPTFVPGAWLLLLGPTAATLLVAGGLGLTAAATALVARDPLAVLRANTRVWRALAMASALAASVTLVAGSVLLWLEVTGS